MLLDPVVFPVFIAIVAIVILAIFFHFVPFFLWLSAKVSGVHISLIQLFLMRIRNVCRPASLCQASSKPIRPA